MISQVHHDQQLFTEVEVTCGKYFTLMNNSVSEYQNSKRVRSVNRKLTQFN